MQEETNHKTLLDKYLKDTLSESEKAEFIILLEDPAFKEDVLTQKRIVASLKASEKAKLKAHLKNISQESPVAKKTGSTSKLWLAAASIALITSIGYLFYVNNQPINTQFDNFYEPYPAVTIQRGEATEINQGLQLYSEGHYNEAVNELMQISGKEQPQYYLYLGNCYLQLEEPEKAIKSFKALIEASNDTILRQHAEWYLALAFLKNNDQEKLNTQLQKIIEKNGMYASLASRLYNELN